MTAQYEGNDIYKLIFGDKEVLLSENEIDEIQCFNFCNMIETKTVGELEDKIEKLEEKSFELAEELDENICKIGENVESDVFDCDDYDSRMDNISKIIGKMQTI